jgi:hypothetical protein
LSRTTSQPKSPLHKRRQTSVSSVAQDAKSRLPDGTWLNVIHHGMSLINTCLLLCPALLVFAQLAWLMAWLSCLPCRNWCYIIIIIIADT